MLLSSKYRPVSQAAHQSDRLEDLCFWYIQSHEKWGRTRDILGRDFCSLTTPFFLSAEMIRALWDLTRSCFAQLNAPQCVCVLERLARHHSGCVLQRDAELLFIVLFGDDTTMSQGDLLLMGIRTTAYGMFPQGDPVSPPAMVTPTLWSATIIPTVCSRPFHPDTRTSC